jgi:V/A-type H+-transporting ATPase subunit A
LNTVYSINGPVVKIKDTKDFSMLEMVYVGKNKLVGEVISITEEFTTIQVYEVTTGMQVGEPVTGSGAPMSVLLGPGIMNNIFDGIERPLRLIADKCGAFIEEGIDVSPLPIDVKYKVTVTAKVGDLLKHGEIFATCQETASIEHRSMLSPMLPEGKVVWVAPDGDYTIVDKIVTIEDAFGKKTDLALSQKWPIRQSRPIKKRIPINRPLITGQRVIDSIVPIAKGGTAAVPGGFGTGKTMTQHQLAKWCDADLIVYIGCGERGNEMTQVLTEFGELVDPRTGRELKERTVLIANTSNMPVAAREASVYTGITLAEYYRDMGYHVAIMADSTSRWAEALREISGRLEEMPAEEGFPAYLPSRLSEFYERAGYVEPLNGKFKEGSVTIIGAVSPQGGDFSEPVTQNTKRFVRCFWALDKSLAYARHYPAINWLQSYSEYMDELGDFYNNEVNSKFLNYRQQISNILIEENRLMEIVKLIGADVLPDDQKLVIETAKVIRVGFLQQNAYHKDDTYVPLEKQFRMMGVVLKLYNKSKSLLSENVPISVILETGLMEKLIKIKYDIPNDKLEMFDQYEQEIEDKLDAFLEANASWRNA